MKKRIWCKYGSHSWIEVGREFLRTEECDLDSPSGTLRQTFNILMQCQHCPEKMKTCVTRTISVGGFDINRDNR